MSFLNISDGDLGSAVRAKLNAIGLDSNVDVKRVSAIADVATEINNFVSGTVVWADNENAFYTYNGSTWVLHTALNNFVHKTGDTMTGDLTFDTAGIEELDSVKFNLLASVVSEEGRLSWNDDDKTLNLGLAGGNSILQIGEEHVVRVKNTSGATILNGSAVYVSGASGNNPTIALANASVYGTSLVAGIATEDIDNNQFGYVTLIGLVRGLNTSSCVAGNLLWLSDTVDGGFSTTMPDAPSMSVNVGICLVQHATEGVIYAKVTIIPRLQALSDVNGTPLATNGQFIVWDNDNGYFDANYNINNYTPKTDFSAGEIHLDGGVTPQSIPTGTTYTKITGFIDNGYSDMNGNVTPDATNSKITLGHLGIYKVSGAFSFSSGVGNINFYGTLFLDGVEQSQIHFKRKIGTSGDVGSASFTGFIQVTSQPVDIDFRIRHDSGTSVDVTFEYMNLNVNIVSE